MDCIESIRYLFQTANDPKALGDLQAQLAQKMKRKEKLEQDLKLYDYGIGFYKAQAYKFERILKYYKENNEYNKRLYSVLHEILGQSALLKFYVDLIPFDEIEKYDAREHAELYEANRQRAERYKQLADQMEQRDIVVQLRAAQAAYSKTVEMTEKFKEVQSQERKHMNAKLEAAIKARNEAIVELIKTVKRKIGFQPGGSENLQIPVDSVDMQFTAAPSQQPPEAAISIDIQFAAAPSQEVAALSGNIMTKDVDGFKLPPPPRTKTLEDVDFESLLNKMFAAPSVDSTSLNLAEGNLPLPPPRQTENMADVDSESSSTKNLASPDTGNSNPENNLLSILRKSDQYEQKTTKHVTIISPLLSPSTCSNDSHESFLMFQPPQSSKIQHTNSAENVVKTINAEMAANVEAALQHTPMPDEASNESADKATSKIDEAQINDEAMAPIPVEKNLPAPAIELNSPSNSSFATESLLIPSSAKTPSPSKAQVAAKEQSPHDVEILPMCLSSDDSNDSPTTIAKSPIEPSMSNSVKSIETEPSDDLDLDLDVDDITALHTNNDDFLNCFESLGRKSNFDNFL